MVKQREKKPFIKNSTEGRARLKATPKVALKNLLKDFTGATSPVLPPATLYRRGLVTLRDLKKKSIDVSWQFKKSDKKQADILQAIEKRLRLIGLDEFHADIKCEKLANKVYGLTAHWSARVRQQCVITLDEFDEIMTGDLQLDFIEERFYDEKKHKDVEPIAGDELDTLEQMVQELSLNLNPYPRKPGATIPLAFRAELTPAINHATNHAINQTPPTAAGKAFAKPFANLADKLKEKKS